LGEGQHSVLEFSLCQLIFIEVEIHAYMHTHQGSMAKALTTHSRHVCMEGDS